GYLTLRAGADYVWFRSHPNLTHTNYASAVRGNLDFRALKLFAAVEYQKNKERPNNEIDHRPKRTSFIQRLGVGYEYSSRTAIDYILSRESIAYEDPDFTYPPLCDRDGDGTFDAHCPTYTLGDLLARTETRGT